MKFFWTRLIVKSKTNQLYVDCNYTPKLAVLQRFCWADWRSTKPPNWLCSPVWNPRPGKAMAGPDVGFSTHGFFFNVSIVLKCCCNAVTPNTHCTNSHRYSIFGHSTRVYYSSSPTSARSISSKQHRENTRKLLVCCRVVGPGEPTWLSFLFMSRVSFRRIFTAWQNRDQHLSWSLVLKHILTHSWTKNSNQKLGLYFW